MELQPLSCPMIEYGGQKVCKDVERNSRNKELKPRVDLLVVQKVI